MSRQDCLTSCRTSCAGTEGTQESKVPPPSPSKFHARSGQTAQRRSPGPGPHAWPSWDKMAVRSHLSDEELRRQLKECGEAVGPITATTRALYLRKLAKLRKSGGTNSSPKSSVMNRAKGKSPVRRSPASKASTSPSRRLIGFSSDEEENESPAKSRRSFLSKRETGAGERQISSRCTDSSKMSQSSFDLSEEESGTGTANQRSHVVSEIDGYVYRGTPLRLRALNQSRLKRSPDSRSKPDEFLGEVPRNSVLRQLGVEGRESHSCRRLVLVLLVSVLIGVALYVFLRNPTFVRNFSSNPGAVNNLLFWSIILESRRAIFVAATQEVPDIIVDRIFLQSDWFKKLWWKCSARNEKSQSCFDVFQKICLCVMVGTLSKGRWDLSKRLHAVKY